MRLDTETHCHCGARYDGCDHCPECGCEQYETPDCGHTAECEGHESLDGAYMGVTVYCDGTCRV